jgi:hypothetical protein
MWGNIQGWFISLVLLGLLMFGMHKLNEVAHISDPTSFGLNEANLGAVELPIAPASLLDANVDTDAKPLYRAAIDDYLSNREAYERFEKSKNAADADKLAGLSNLLDAARSRKATLFADDPGQIVKYGDKPELEALVGLGKAASRAALLKSLTDPAAGQNYFGAEFALGARLYEERITVAEFAVGLGLLSDASSGLINSLRKSNQPARASEFQAFYDGYLKYNKDRIQPMRNVLESIDANIVAEHTGDLFQFARHCTERMYRVEAIFALGRLRYFAGENGRIGDQTGAMKELKLLAQSPDPIIARAAREARDMTVQQYRMLK